MNAQKRPLGKTYVTQSYPWGLFYRNGHRVQCADGVLRAAELSETADTFFSIPARLRYKGRSVTGYVTATELKYIRGEVFDDRRVYTFHPHTENAPPELVWPTWPKEAFTSEKADKIDRAINDILRKAL